MNTLEFLTAVMPSEGWYVVITIDEGRAVQRYCETIQEVEATCLTLDQSGHNTYFAPNAFWDNSSREQKNVRASKALYIDIDCGAEKPFPDQIAGGKALRKFLRDSHLPAPMVVSSGRGLHVYWPLTRELPIDEWKILANALKRKTGELGFKVDPAPTADAARVLRPVGTKNPKSGTVVEVLYPAEAADPDKLKELLLGGSLAHNPPPVSVKVPPRNTLNLATTSEFPPANADVIEVKCKQINWGVNNQDKVEEPFWYAMLGVAAYAANPEDVAIRWSSQHPEYDRVKTIAKMTQWKEKLTGPALCERFKALRDKGCQGCAFADKIKTPAMIGLQQKEKEFQENDLPEGVAYLKPPAPYKQANNGIYVSIDDTDIEVCNFDIFPVAYGYDEGLGYAVVHFKWYQKHVGWRDLKFGMALLADGNRDFATELGKNFIVLKSAKQQQAFQAMMRAYMEELKQLRNLTNNYSSMGWKSDFTEFVIGNRVVRRDGVKDINMSAQISVSNAKMYTQKGSFEEWIEGTKVLGQLNLDIINYMIMVSLSSPLYEFGGLKGFTYSLVGESGTGKSLTQILMQSVWGDPVELTTGHQFTMNSFNNRCSTIANLPMTLDETTMMPKEELSKAIYGMTQGKEKMRLTREAKEREVRNYALPLTLSTNRSVALQVANGMTEGDAQLIRMLEITLKMAPAFKKSSQIGATLYNHFTRNYGWIGERFAQYCINLGPAAIEAALEQHIKVFEEKFKIEFTGPERYISNSVIKAHWGGTVGATQGWLKFDVDAATRAAISHFRQTKDTMMAERADGFDLLSEYMSEFGRQTVHVMNTADSSAPPSPFGVNLMGRLTEIRIRLDFYRQTSRSPITSGTIMIDRNHFKNWLLSRHGNYTAFKDEMDRNGVWSKINGGRGYLGKNTDIRTPQTYVFVLKMSHPRLNALLDAAASDVDHQTEGPGNIGVVRNEP